MLVSPSPFHWTTRVEFDPPSLRHYANKWDLELPAGNEGRIRPSFIEAVPVV